jgi:hypothetical protein
MAVTHTGMITLIMPALSYDQDKVRTGDAAPSAGILLSSKFLGDPTIEDTSHPHVLF